MSCSVGEKQRSVLTFHSQLSDLLHRTGGRRRRWGEEGGRDAGDSLPQPSELFPGALTALGLPGSMKS